MCLYAVQEAVAVSFDMERQRLSSPECYHNLISEELRPKRDKMAKFLEEVGMMPTVPEAGYFMVADFSNLRMFLTAALELLNIPQVLVVYLGILLLNSINPTFVPRRDGLV